MCVFVPHVYIEYYMYRYCVVCVFVREQAREEEEEEAFSTYTIL